MMGMGAALVAIGALLPIISRGTRAAIVRAAQAEVGKSNPRPYVESALGYWEPGLEWCGLFCLYCLHRAGLATEWRWQIDKGFLYRLQQIPASEVQGGDFPYFHRPHQHQAVVEWRDGPWMSTINGNGGGGRVTRVVRPVKDATSFYSPARLLKG